jgi:hypothetical protein
MSAASTRQPSTLLRLAATAILAFAALALGMSGRVLWPAVALHAALGVWCFASLRPGAGGE